MTAREKQETETPKQAAERDAPNMAITVDYERYAHMLDDPELSETAKREFLQTLWNIVLELIDIGVEVHAKSSLDQSCGKLAETAGDTANGGKSAVHCKDRSTKKSFAEVALEERGGA